jgi:hypothetical protein
VHHIYISTIFSFSAVLDQIAKAVKTLVLKHIGDRHMYMYVPCQGNILNRFFTIFLKVALLASSSNFDLTVLSNAFPWNFLPVSMTPAKGALRVFNMAVNSAKHCVCF